MSKNPDVEELKKCVTGNHELTLELKCCVCEETETSEDSVSVLDVYDEDEERETLAFHTYHKGWEVIEGDVYCESCVEVRRMEDEEEEEEDSDHDDALGDPVPLSRCEMSTILAALRSWQSKILNPAGAPGARNEMPDHFTQHEPLTSDQVDMLCEKINANRDQC